jgi:ferritin
VANKRENKMINKKIEKSINEQINAELYSAYLYLSISADMESKNLNGAATWMKAQAQEEVGHAMKFYAYLAERGGKVELMAIKEPKKEWGSLLEAFEDAYEHECYISGRINDMMDLAVGEKDYATITMLQWFVEEQVEEEASTDGVVQKLKLVGDSKNGLFMMDRALGQRGSE